jgi:hypothetical protein
VGSARAVEVNYSITPVFIALNRYGTIWSAGTIRIRPYDKDVDCGRSEVEGSGQK